MATVPPTAALLNERQTKIRFLIAGGLNTAFGFAAFPALTYLLVGYGASVFGVLLVSQISGLIFGYFTQKLITFKTVGGYFDEFRKFSVFYVVLYVINYPVMWFGATFFNLPSILIQTAFTALGIFTSYFWHKHITFSPKMRAS